MPSQDVIFEASDVEQLYRGGKPSTWEEMLERADRSSHRRRSISDDEAHEMVIALRLIRESGSAIPDTPRECYLQMLQVLAALPMPEVYPT